MSPADPHPAMLAKISASLGPAGQRRLSSANQVRVPVWVRRENPLNEIRRRQALLLRHGEVVWGALVQANNKLFAPGVTAMPAAMVYATRADAEAIPFQLMEAAREIGRLKSVVATGHPDMRRLAEIMNAETVMEMKAALPAEAVGGGEAYLTSVLLDPRHLPRGMVEGSLMPMLRHESTSALIMVPHWHWPASFVQRHWPDAAGAWSWRA